MPTLKELLDDLEIDTKTDEVNLKDVKIDDIPEEHRPIFKRAMGIIEEQTNEISRRDIMIDALKTVKPKEEAKEEKVLGVLEPDDPYAPAFKKLSDAIEVISSRGQVDKAKTFETSLKEFAADHKDIVRYVKEMDQLLVDHPTLQSDVPKLYTLAKSTKEGREKLSKHETVKPQRTETSGMPTSNVDNLTQGKSISEAFDLAEKNLNRR